MMTSGEQALEAIAAGTHADPFSVLGPHQTGKRWRLRTMQPQAQSVEVVREKRDSENGQGGNGSVLAKMKRVHPAGVFECSLSSPPGDYRLRLFESGGTRIIDDPYRFGSLLGDVDRYLMSEGTHRRLYEKLGAHAVEIDGVTGVHFAVWAPNARRVSVVGEFNGWDGRSHPMRLHPDNGLWDLFVPGLGDGALYKFELIGGHGQRLPLKADPFARRMEPPPGNASVVYSDAYEWKDRAWVDERGAKTALDRPVAIYEAHLGSWRRRGDDQSSLSYRELSTDLVPYVKEMGYTHIELLPVTEHPFEGSWGYQPIGLFAPTWRHGSPEDFKRFVDACHEHDLGVIMDWVPAHFPRDEFGLGVFDGSHLYEHADPRQGAHPDWGTLVFNYGRAEVVSYLIASALFWVKEFHVDVLRVDAVASMLYLDYSREAGQWVPNEHGGNENLEAVAFLRAMNEAVHAAGGVTVAEESTAWPQVSRPVYLGGLGFTYKWNMGWMNDTLAYFKEDPVHRRYHHDKLTFSLMYAFTENFLLPLSHDEVVHGKGSLLARMPGDTWQKFANLRLCFTFMYGHPGKKLLFMGSEFAQGREWNHETSLDWDLLDEAHHAGVQRLNRDLNRLYRSTPALYEVDFDPGGFEWIDCTDNEQGVIAFVRRARDPADLVVVVCNLTPAVREDYRIGVPVAGSYRERLNSDAREYAGSGVGNLGTVSSQAIVAHARAQSISLTLPPLAALVLQPELSEH